MTLEVSDTIKYIRGEAAKKTPSLNLSMVRLLNLADAVSPQSLPSDVRPKCQWCGEPWHTAICPLIKRIEFAADGRTWQAVEFHPQPDQVIPIPTATPLLCPRAGIVLLCPTEAGCMAAEKCLNSLPVHTCDLCKNAATCVKDGICGMSGRPLI